MQYSVLIIFIIMKVGFLIFNIFPKELSKIFNVDKEVTTLGISALGIMSVSFVSATIGYSAPTLLQTMGKRKELRIIYH